MASGILASAKHQLPTELVLIVLQHLSDDYKSLCTLARTSRALQHLAEEHIYRTIELSTVRALHAIIEAFTYRHERIRAVHTLKLQYHYDAKDLDENMHMRKTFNECVAHMVNLREWYVESPYDNCHWDEGEGPQQWVEGDMARFREALDNACNKGPVETQRILAERQVGNTVDRTVGLALLESLTIHSHGVDSDYWDLDSFECLFRHPSLRHLHMSCVSLTEELPTLRAHAGKTPLSTLVFDECDLSVASLRDILSTPAGLKQLTLGENVWNTRRSKRLRPRLNKNATASLEALSPVAHSLESLTHIDPSWKLDFESHKPRRITSPGDGLRNFHSLKFLQCETTSFLHQATIMNHELAPPNLETLRLCRHYTVPFDFFDRLPEIETYLALPSLSTLELMQSSHCWHELSDGDYICEAERLRGRHGYAYKLFKAGINMKVLLEMHRDNRIIPPYLHGEARPIIECVYDAAEVGFKRHIVDQASLEILLDVDRRIIDQVLGAGEEATYSGEAAAHAQNVIARQEQETKDIPPPETDQLCGNDVHRMEKQTNRSVQALRQKLHPRRRFWGGIPPGFPDAGLGGGPMILSDDEDDFSAFEDDFDENDEELEEMEIDEEDFDLIVHNGELYLEIYGNESDTENEVEDGDVMDQDGPGAGGTVTGIEDVD